MPIGEAVTVRLSREDMDALDRLVQSKRKNRQAVIRLLIRQEDESPVHKAKREHGLSRAEILAFEAMTHA